MFISVYQGFCKLAAIAINQTTKQQKKRNQCPCKPGSVRTVKCVPVIYPGRRSPCGSSILPSVGVGRAGNPQTTVYMNLQPPGDTAHRSPGAWWSLTHTFSPLPHALWTGAVVFFCPSVLSPTPSTLRSGAPCAARTFLPRCRFPRALATLGGSRAARDLAPPATGRGTDSGCKIRKFCLILRTIGRRN